MLDIGGWILDTGCLIRDTGYFAQRLLTGIKRSFGKIKAPICVSWYHFAPLWHHHPMARHCYVMCWRLFWVEKLHQRAIRCHARV